MNSRRAADPCVVQPLESRLLLSGGAAAVAESAPTRPARAPGFVHMVARLSAARFGMASAVAADGRIIFAGGASGGMGGTETPSDVVDLYDPAANRWTTARLSEARSQSGVVRLGAVTYFIGGSPRSALSAAVDAYDGATGAWSTAPDLPRPALIQGGYAVGDQLVCWGAVAWAQSGDATEYAFVYDARAGAWSEHLLTARSAPAAARAGSKLVLVPNEFGRDAEVYDAAIGQWSTAVGVLGAARNDQAFSVGDHRVVIAGDGIGAGDLVTVFDGRAGTWTTARPPGVGGLELFRAVSAIGDHRALFKTLTDAYTYDLDTGAWTTEHLPTVHGGDGYVAAGRVVAAGGFTFIPGQLIAFPANEIDLYDPASGRWSTSQLVFAGTNPETTAVVGPKVLFAGYMWGGGVEVDVLDVVTGRVTSTTRQPGAALSSFAVAATDRVAVFAGGDLSDAVDLFTADAAPPTATLVSAPTLRKGLREYRFTVAYHDATGRVDAGTLGDDDVVVTGPNGFVARARLVSQAAGKHASTRVAEYAVRDPGGLWAAHANGVYGVHVQGGAVADIAGNGVESLRVGRFRVAVPAMAAVTPPPPLAAGAFQSRRPIDDLFGA